MKRNIELAKKEEDLQSLIDFKDSDIAMYYHMERQKM